MEVDFVAVRASKNHRVPQLSTSTVQQVQYQSVRNNKLQQISTRFGIWFGTRCSTRCMSWNSFKSNIQKFPDVENY
jgi:hypothetical protein